VGPTAGMDVLEKGTIVFFTGVRTRLLKGRGIF
jgi:hypothetical protein